MIRSALSALDRWTNEKPRRGIFLCAALLFIMTGMQWLQMDLSCGTPIITILTRRWVYPFINLGLVFIVDLFLLLITRRWHMAYILGSIFFLIWTIANHYTWLFSGDVITLSSLRSIGTAMNVLGGYHLSVDIPIVLLLLSFPVNILLSLLVKHLTKPLSWRKESVVLCLMLVLGSASYGVLDALQSIDPLRNFNARRDVQDYGYPVHVIRNAVRMIGQNTPPTGYSDEALDALAATAPEEHRSQEGTAPDIILILNETFYDLDHYTPIEADTPYLDTWHSMENAVTGYAVVPSVGGGTNQSEYEFLTSNSMHLLACQAPFNTMDLSGANSIVSYLKKLGYVSPWAIHAYSSRDYNRTISYPALGFENIRFHEDLNSNSYGNRYMLDEDNYQDLFMFYLAMDDAPRFMYLLTFQNHGGYEQNDASLDTVHTGRDFGDLTDDVNEFLTSIRMSDAALSRLTTYFNNVDRPVIICMVGDHAPSFINQLPSQENMSEQEKEIVLRSTPFFIWANDAFGPIDTQDADTVSLPDLVPMILDMAGLPLSTYYQTILDLSEQIPVRLSTGTYRTAEGEYGNFSQEDERFPLLSPYYFMEYNNLQRSNARRQELFDPAITADEK